MKKLLCVIPLVLLFCFTFGCQDKKAMAELEKFKAQAEVEEQNKAVVRQVFEAIDAQNFAPFKELLTPELIVHYSGPQEDLTLDTGIQLIKTFYQAFCMRINKTRSDPTRSSLRNIFYLFLSISLIQTKNSSILVCISFLPLNFGIPRIIDTSSSSLEVK